MPGPGFSDEVTEGDFPRDGAIWFMGKIGKKIAKALKRRKVRMAEGGDAKKVVAIQYMDDGTKIKFETLTVKLCIDDGEGGFTTTTATILGVQN